MLWLVPRSVADCSFVEFIVCADGLVMFSLHLLNRVVEFFLKPKELRFKHLLNSLHVALTFLFILLVD